MINAIKNQVRSHRFMRKKSHFSLSVYLVDNLDSMLLENHKKAFIMGSILPDCKPSFVTTRHNMEETFDMVSDFISKLTVDSADFKKISTSYCRKLGEVTHYLADYFTFPHNAIFDGNMKEHCMYEKELKFALREYIQSGDVYVNRNIALQFSTPDELCDFVKELHMQYLDSNMTVDSDCMYIVSLCHIVVEGILNLLKQNRTYQMA
jgi:hypothetical protein